MRKKDLPSAYTNYLENLVQAGILKMDKKASAPVSLPQKLDEKILDFCERLRKASFHKQAQEIEENFVSYKGLSSKLEAMIRDNMVGEHYEASTQLLGLPESATIYSPIEKQIETARKMLGEPLSKQADFIKTAAGFGEDVAEFAISPLAKLFQKLNAELNTSDVQSNIDTINENIVDINNIIADDLIEFTIDIGDYQPTKIYIKKDGQKRNQKNDCLWLAKSKRSKASICKWFKNRTKIYLMKKNIDIPDDVRWDLEILAKQEKKDLKTFIQDVLISLVRGQNKKTANRNVKSKH